MGLYLQLFSIHGLIRSHNLELGRDADTGGQTKYMVELCRALGEHPEIERVDLFTRLIEDKRVSRDYAEPLEPINDKARIVRVKAGPKRYIRKELLWPYLDEFVEGVLRVTREHRPPDLVHGHYADAGYVALELAGYFGVPLIFTGHSLGRNKLRALTNAGHSEAEIDKQYHIFHRISVEETVLRAADLVIASTQHEVERGYELYEAHRHANYRVIPPGIQVTRFYPYYYDMDEGFDPGEAVIRARFRMREEIKRFLREPQKPLILAISRPDRRKNIDGLVTAYGEDKELQAIANLAIFAGVRKDIAQMDDNERDVLTQMLLLMDKYDLYGKLALPKKHDPETDIPVLYRIAAASGGVFINPALVENFGITLIEASSSGLPVVSTDHGGPQDIIKNCQSGLLIDARDTAQIQSALKRILVNREEWERFSAAGIEGVRRHYSWQAHVERYLEAITPLLKGGKGAGVAPRLERCQRLLISDIDHTLIDEGGEGDPEALAELAELLKAHDIGFGVASGRSLELIEAALEAHSLPRPDIVIAAVGSEIYYGPKLVPDKGYQRYISHRWQPEKLRELLGRFDCIKPQAPEAQRPFKLSYELADEGVLDKLHAALEEAKLRCKVIYSHGRLLDLLPPRASKGGAIRYVSRKWGIAPERIAVAGDSGNDEEMLRGSFCGIVVGNHAEELAKLKGKPRIYFAKGRYARGVIEGLKHYGFIA